MVEIFKICDHIVNLSMFMYLLQCGGDGEDILKFF